jgi:acetylornithine deacetylase/succinyl-diaminopimelate desuccinylase-like protein
LHGSSISEEFETYRRLTSFSHSGYPHLGKSATAALIAAINDLASADWPSNDLLGKSTFNIGTLSGGEKHNIVAPSARSLCEVRMVSDLPGVKQQVKDIVSKHPDVQVEFVFEYPNAELEWEIDGFEAEAVAFGTDVPRLRAEFCKRRILYGPGSILVAHGPDEYIPVPELIESIQGYKKLILHLLK